VDFLLSKHFLQIRAAQGQNSLNNLRYVLVPILGIKRPESAGKCLTGCATFGKVCNRTCVSLGVRFPGATHL